jgi:hypothetical protein
MTNELLKTIDTSAIAPALKIVGFDNIKARVMLLAIGLQESRFTHRVQMGNGPARGLWQFEKGGGVRGVIKHPTSADRCDALCKIRGVVVESDAVWRALAKDDVLAAGFARLLLLTDPKPLPSVDDTEGAWAYYLRNWRPGKPHEKTWAAFHKQAREFYEV